MAKKFNWNPFKRTYAAKDLERLEYLAQIKIFKALTLNELALFLPYIHERSFSKDEIVFFRGDPSLALYLIRAGEISLTLDYQNDLEELTSVRAGRAMGESCLLKGTKRLFNATVASESSDMYVIPQLNIHEIFDNSPLVKSKMFEALSEIYHSYNHDLFQAYRKSLGFFHLPMVYGNKS